MRSNPLKPFKMCHAWAWRVLEEFFNQAPGMVSRQVLLVVKPVACIDCKHTSRKPTPGRH